MKRKSRPKRNAFGRRIPAFLVILLIIFIMTTVGATAILFHTLSVKRIDAFGGQIQGTDFSITDWNIKLKGKKTVEVTVYVYNTDSSQHTANVFAQLLDNAGVLLLEDNVIAVIAGTSTWSNKFTFTQEDLVAKFTEAVFYIHQID